MITPSMFTVSASSTALYLNESYNPLSIYRLLLRAISTEKFRFRHVLSNPKKIDKICTAFNDPPPSMEGSQHQIPKRQNIKMHFYHIIKIRLDLDHQKLEC